MRAVVRKGKRKWGLVMKRELARCEEVEVEVV